MGGWAISSLVYSIHTWFENRHKSPQFSSSSPFPLRFITGNLDISLDMQLHLLRGLQQWPFPLSDIDSPTAGMPLLISSGPCNTVKRGPRTHGLENIRRATGGRDLPRI